MKKALNLFLGFLIVSFFIVSSLSTKSVHAQFACPTAGSNASQYCSGNSLVFQYADGKCGMDTQVSECGGSCVSMNGSGFCQGGITPVPTSYPLPTSVVCPTAGSNPSQYCSGNSLVFEYADGRCGTTTQISECGGSCTMVNGSGFCQGGITPAPTNYPLPTSLVCPQAGFNPNQYCSGNSLIYQYADGKCGITTQISDCGGSCVTINGSGFCQGGITPMPTISPFPKCKPGTAEGPPPPPSCTYAGDPTYCTLGALVCPSPTPAVITIPSSCDPQHDGPSSHVIDDNDFAWWKDEIRGIKSSKDSDCLSDGFINIYDFNRMRDIRFHLGNLLPI